MEKPRDAGVPKVGRIESVARLEARVRELRRAHAVEAERARGVDALVPCVHAPHRQLTLDRVRLDQTKRRAVVAFFEVLDLDDDALLRRLAQDLDERLLVRRVSRLGSPGEIEAAKGLLEFLADTLERRVRVGGDRRADVLDCQADRTSFERRELGRAPEDIAVELLVDAYDVTFVHRIHGVTAAAEVHEIEKREVILKLLDRDGEPRCQLACVEHGGTLVSAGGEKLREERLEDTESLRSDGSEGSLRQR